MHNHPDARDAIKPKRSTIKPKSVYLAGPDVFRPDAVAYGKAQQALCAAYGITGLYPLDLPLSQEIRTPAERSEAIARGNRGLILAADAVLANLAPFRGTEPDSGTVWECGFAYGRGIPVIGYIPEGGDYADQVRRRFGLPASAVVDCEGYTLEDFGNPVNLMLAHSMTLVVGNFAAALQRLVTGIPELYAS